MHLLFYTRSVLDAFLFFISRLNEKLSKYCKKNRKNKTLTHWQHPTSRRQDVVRSGKPRHLVQDPRQGESEEDAGRV